MFSLLIVIYILLKNPTFLFHPYFSLRYGAYVCRDEGLAPSFPSVCPHLGHGPCVVFHRTGHRRG